MANVKKTVVKVNINCGRCKKDVLQAVTKLCDINQVTIDSEKGTLTVIGSVDPVLIVKQLKKAGKFAEIVSVGPPKTPDKPVISIILPPICNDCQLVPVGYAYYGYGERSGCNIL